MFAATDTDAVPWYVADSNDKRRARLNIISHLLSQIPYERNAPERVELPEREGHGDYVEPDRTLRWVPARF